MVLGGFFILDRRSSMDARQCFVDDVSAHYPILGASREPPPCRLRFWERARTLSFWKSLWKAVYWELYGHGESIDGVTLKRAIRLDQDISQQEIVEDVRKFISARRSAAEEYGVGVIAAASF
jgi:hypothetical protein